MRHRRAALALLVLLNAALVALPASGADLPDPWVFGVKLRAGGRYDNVRRCVATSVGTPGGPAADISVFTEVPAGDGRAVHIDLPVMRPILFATAFHMLQFEPSVTLKFRDKSDASVGWVLGPTLGVALHYGPDYRSELDGAKFFAIGPIIGGYAGLDFRRPGKTFNVELGVTPYVIPMFGVSDPASHRGIVVGGLLDAAFRFGSGSTCDSNGACR
jgi:hypothetical protein